MNLYLVDNRLDFSGGKQLLEPCNRPVGNTDRSCLTLFQNSLHCRPHQRWIIRQALFDDVLRISSASSLKPEYTQINTYFTICSYPRLHILCPLGSNRPM